MVRIPRRRSRFQDSPEKNKREETTFLESFGFSLRTERLPLCSCTRKFGSEKPNLPQSKLAAFSVPRDLSGGDQHHVDHA